MSEFRQQMSSTFQRLVVSCLLSGQVLRPAIYELKGGERVEDLIELAGGMGEKAFAGSARIERIGDDGFMTALDLNLETSSSRNVRIKGGDHLTIDGIINRQKRSVNLTYTLIIQVYSPSRME